MSSVEEASVLEHVSADVSSERSTLLEANSEDQMLQNGAAGKPADTIQTDGPYSKYVLLVLTLVYAMSYADRNVILILVEDIKADLGISDAAMGFLGGTLFALFYAVFGIVLGRLADIWNRKKLISVGVGFWSLMTVLSGLARNFLTLSVCRFGVAVGEASATPAAYSLLYDYFSPRLRTRALAVYSMGGVIGAGMGVYLGGQILDFWGNTWPDPGSAPFGLKGWQATFIIIGLPGVLVALWVSTLHEPRRGRVDGIVGETSSTPFKETVTLMMGMLPIVNLWVFNQFAARRKIVTLNLSVGGLLLLVMFGLIQWTGSLAQWLSTGIAIYAIFSWSQMLAIKDPVIFRLISSSKALLYAMVGSAVILIGITGGAFWGYPFFLRHHGVEASELASILGLGGIPFAIVGHLLGGTLGDLLQQRRKSAKLMIAMVAYSMVALMSVVICTTSQLAVAYGAALFSGLFLAMATAPLHSTIIDLMLPRGRSSTIAFYIVIASLAASLGPYIVGYISDYIATTGVNAGDALRFSILWGLLTVVIGLPILMGSLRHLVADQRSLLDRARALGEKV